MTKFRCPACGVEFEAERPQDFQALFTLPRCACGNRCDAKDEVPPKEPWHPVRWIGRQIARPFRAAWSVLAWPWRKWPKMNINGLDFRVNPVDAQAVKDYLKRQREGYVPIYHDDPNVMITAGSGSVYLGESSPLNLGTSGSGGSLVLPNSDNYLPLGERLSIYQTPAPNASDPSRCRWDFKNKECGYVGASPCCDKTWRDCQKHHNAARFGGMPEMHGIVNAAQAKREAMYRPKANEYFGNTPVPSPWQPKVGEWVMITHTDYPYSNPRVGDVAKIVSFAPSGAAELVVPGREHGYQNALAFYVSELRPLALSEVQNAEQAKQFYGRSLRHPDGRIGTIKEFYESERIWKVEEGIGHGFMMHSDISGQYTILPDKPEVPQSEEQNA